MSHSTSNDQSNEDLSNKRTSPRFSNIIPDFNYLINSEGLHTNDETPSKKHRINNNNNNNNNNAYPIDPNFVLQNHLQKLDFLYQNLEGRVQKLENYVADQLVSSNISCRAQGNITNSISPAFTLNDFSTSSLNSGPGGSSSSSTVVSILENIPKEISRSDLDDYCSPVLQRRATPTIGELNSIVMNLKKLKYPDLDNKFILSKVREWFRRKREYMSQRIFNVCFKKYGHLAHDPLAIEELIREARNNPIFITEIGNESNLEITSKAGSWEFCSEKVSSYFENLYNSTNGSSSSNLKSSSTSTSNSNSSSFQPSEY